MTRSLLPPPAGPSGGSGNVTVPAAGPPRRWPRAAVTAGCLAVIAYAGAFHIYPQAEAQWHWRQARQAGQDEDFARARSLWEQCLRVWPESGEAHYQLARVLRRQGDFTAARRHLQLARRYDWAVSALDLEFKLIQAQTGGVRAAEGALHEYVESDHPESPLILEALVQGYLKNSLLNDAYRSCSAWMKSRPDQWQPYYWRGQVLERGLKLALAADDYQAVLDRRPDHLDTRHRLAQILLRIGKYDEAAPHFEAYLARHPDDGTAVVGYVRCLRALARADEARAVAEGWLQHADGSAPLFALLGQLELDRERYPEALAWLRRAEALTPKDRELLQTLADVHKRMDQPDAAAAYEKKRQEVEADVRRVEALIKDVVARETARPEQKDWTKIVELRYELGVTLLRLGNDDEAAQWLVGALQEDPGHAGARKALAELKGRTAATPK